jgi:hypothetical protein
MWWEQEVLSCQRIHLGEKTHLAEASALTFWTEYFQCQHLGLAAQAVCVCTSMVHAIPPPLWVCITQRRHTIVLQLTTLSM